MSRDVGQWVRGRRQELGISIRDLETVSGVSRSTILRIEAHAGTVAMASVIAVVQSLQGKVEVDGGEHVQASERDDPGSAA